MVSRSSSIQSNSSRANASASSAVSKASRSSQRARQPPQAAIVELTDIAEKLKHFRQVLYFQNTQYGLLRKLCQKTDKEVKALKTRRELLDLRLTGMELNDEDTSSETSSSVVSSPSSSSGSSGEEEMEDLGFLINDSIPLRKRQKERKAAAPPSPNSSSSSTSSAYSSDDHQENTETIEDEEEGAPRLDATADGPSLDSDIFGVTDLEDASGWEDASTSTVFRHSKMGDTLLYID
ncbi:hypothetical protein M3Y99_01684500 [Aphelenchoides fujianensis]|nr:hypothetical protein M3Y99_01684500 [Aphelenchoides fujianensis]